MKNAIIITILSAVLVAGGFWLYLAKTRFQQPPIATNGPSQTTTDQAQSSGVVISGVDTNDYLDPAVQDLRTVESAK